MEVTGEVRPLFPAGAVVRYRNPEHREIPVDDLEFSENYGGSTTVSTSPDLNILEEARFSQLNTFVHACVRHYLDEVMCYEYEDFSVIHAWVNRAPDKGIQRMHYHGNSIISGCYYLKANKDSAPLWFEKAEMNSHPYIAIASKKPNMFTANRIPCPVSTGTCYLFPSQIKHGYETENQGGERISLAFNVMLSGIGLFYRV